jgi:3-dehydroquinate synthase
MSGRVINVALSDTSYDVVIEPGLLARIGELVAGVCDGPAAVLAVDRAIQTTHGAVADRSLRDAGFTPTLIALSADESCKTLSAVHEMYEQMLAGQVRPTRESPVVAIGGGIVGDTAGFAAATFQRGLPLVHVPTTLLAMVDASIGGKTGVNFALPGGGLGKNLIGAFWQPKAVLIDPMVLGTLGERDLRCGLAECVKAAIIADATLLEYLSDRVSAILALDTSTLVDLIDRCVRIKVGIVREDERETGRRALLNLGHTFAHAIEAQQHLGLRHGEAVSIGLAAAMECGVRTGRMNEADRRRVRTLLETIGLPVAMPEPVPLGGLMHAMQFDKKAVGGHTRLIIPDGIGGASIRDDVPDQVVDAAWVSVGAS